jgi:hypothetical protein
MTSFGIGWLQLTSVYRGELSLAFHVTHLAVRRAHKKNICR